MIESTARTDKDILVLAEFLPALPARIGSNIALDASAHAVLVFASSRLHGEEYNHPAHAAAYTRAVQALKVCISTERSTVSEETVCAAVALANVEVWSSLLCTESVLTSDCPRSSKAMESS